MKRKLVFYTAFNTFLSNKLTRRPKSGRPHPATTTEWTKKRLDIWRRFTLKSILNQDYKDFIYVLLLNPKLRLITDPLLPKLEDDRIIYSYEDEPLIRGLQEYDELVMALLDSDDMYSHDAGTLMMNCPGPWMYFKGGYALDMKRWRLYPYNTRGSGPFYAQLLPGNKLTHFNRTKHKPCHEDILKFKSVRLSNGKFCVGIHGRNTSSTMRMPHIGKKNLNLKILKEFGISMEV